MMEGILEGLLYVQGDTGLTLKEVMSILSLSEEEAKALVYKLKLAYEEEDRGLRLNYLGNTFKLTTKQEHKEYFEKVLESPSTHVLSQAALEVLAKGLLKEAGRSDMPGHPILYKTTDDFLDYFGLSTKEDLPDIENVVVEVDKEKDLFHSNYKEVREEVLN